MKELPKELTSELLGLVLGIEVSEIATIVSNNGALELLYSDDKHDIYINLDTLARLMKEWLHINDVMFKIEYPTNKNPHKISLMTYGNDSRYFVNGAELEIATRCVSYTATKKGLL